MACIWLASIGTALSAYFILAANAWMQHPVGSVVNTTAGRAELRDFGAVLTNSTAIGAFTHTITAAFVTAGVFVAAISAWHLTRGQHSEVFRPSIRLALVTVFIASVGVAVTGDLQARLMTQQQPMKMAAAEALYDTVAPASFSLFTIGSLNGSKEVWRTALIVTHHPEQVHGLPQVRLTRSNRPHFDPATDESQLTTSHYPGGS